MTAPARPFQLASNTAGHRGRPRPTTPGERYTARLEEASARIIAAVHDEGPDAVQAAIDGALIVEQPAGVDPVEALIVVLAAQVDPCAPRQARLGWTDHLDGGAA